MRDAAEVLGPRQGAVAKELTKRHETVLRGALDELADGIDKAGSEITRGEFVVLIEQGEGVEVSDQVIAEHLETALGAMSLRDAAREVAGELGVKRNRVYRLGLALAGNEST